MKINLGVGAKIAVVIRTAIHLVLPSFSSAQTRSIPRLVLDTRRNRATFTCAVETKSKDSNARETRSRMNPQMKSSMGHVNGVDAVTSEVVLCVNKLAAAVAGHARRRAEVIPTSASSENGNAPITRLSRWFICLLCVILLATTALPQTQQTVVVPGDKVTKTVWVAAAQYNVQNKKDYGSIVLAASMNAFYKTYPNATPAQTQDVVTAIQSRLSGLPKTDYVFAHQTQEELVHAAFNIVGDTLPPMAKVSLSVGREAYDMLRREQNALLDEQGKVAAETGLDVGFRMSTDSAFVQQQFEQLYDNAKKDPTRAALIDRQLGPNLGSPTSATIDSILQANPSFQQFKEIQYIKAHIVSNDQFQDGLANVKKEFGDSMTELKTKIGDDVIPLLQSINQTELNTFATFQDYIAATAQREQLRQLAEQQRAAHDLQLQATQSGVYLLSTFTGLLDPKFGKTLSVVGTTAIQVNQALANFNIAATSVDTSLVGSSFTGAQLGSVVLTGNLVGAAMQLASLFENNPSPDQVILDQVAQLREQITQMQAIMVQRFDRIDGQLNQISGSLDSALKQLSLIGTNVVQVQTQLFSLQSQVSRLELEVHDWLKNSDRIDLLTAINTALGYEQRNGRRMSFPEYVNFEGTFYTWVTAVVRDTTRAGPDYAKDIVMANQLKFPLSSIINYLAQMVSQLFGFPPIVQPGTRVASLDDYLFSASAYYLLIKENPDYVSQIPGAVSRLDDVASAGAQLKAVLDGIGSKDLFLNASQGLVARYQQARDALKAAIAGYKDNTFIPANTCGSSSFDGCIPPGVSLWEDASKTTSYQPSVPPINRCDGGPALNLTVPANNIYYAVPPALLLADQRTGDHPIGLCFEAHFTDTDQGPNIKGVSMTIRVTYRGLLMLSMTAQAGHNGVPWLVCPTTCGGPVDVYWYFLPSSGQVAQGWDVSVKKGQFEDHTQITVSTQPWAQQLYQVLYDKRALYYESVSQQFGNQSPIDRAATDLNVAKALLSSFIELGMPRTLQGNDYLRALLYGNQQLYLGFDPVYGIDVKGFYTNAGSTTPEIDIAPPTDARINAVATVIAQVFSEIAAGQFTENNLQLEQMIRKLGNSSTVAGAGPPNCSYTVSPTSVSIPATGGISAVSVTTNDPSCPWSVAGLPSWIHSTATGLGSASAPIDVDQNMTATPRSVVITVAAQSVTISQEGAAVLNYRISASPESASVKQGGSVISTISLTSSGGYSGPVSFGCGALPTGVACSFAQTSLTAKADGTAVTTTLTITTTGASAMLSQHGSHSVFALYFTTLGFGSVGFVIIGAFRRRKSAAAPVVLFVLLALLGIIAACARVGTGTSNSNLTPTGPFTVTVKAVAVSGGMQPATPKQELSLTIIVTQ